MRRHVALEARNGQWSVARIGKRCVIVAQGLTEADARAKAKELTR